uniref:Uncharacterized protein n=1 Tax=Calcidiscus leptoporus TaxID=127549 RepID=A0A7S0J5G1_9EUKA|mmetsp:Transcript_40505/g.94576  ORF Transcript_40505/g.94576 Transcript_40505/m.94576 type:complete len:364 (+) Transcript_40505:505-1596(+)
MMVLDGLQHDYEAWQATFADDPIFRQFAMAAPPVRRVLNCYGYNIKTPIGAVYRRRAVAYERLKPQSAFERDTECALDHPGYSVRGGQVFETPELTPQADATKLIEDPETPASELSYGARASGDRTVPYWSLKWPITWRAAGVDVDEAPIARGDHRGILAMEELHCAIFAHVSDRPVKYVEVLLLGARVRKGISHVSPALLRLVQGLALGSYNEDVFVQLEWRGAIFRSELVLAKKCDGTPSLPWKQARFLVGINEADLAQSAQLALSVRRPFEVFVANGDPLLNTHPVMISAQELIDGANGEQTTVSLGRAELLVRLTARDVDANGRAIMPAASVGSNATAATLSPAAPKAGDVIIPAVPET